MPILRNPRHEAFARAVAKGADSTAAYGKTYPKASHGSANAAGARLLAKVRPRVTELQGMAEDGTLLTIAEKRQFCADVLRTPIADIDEHSPLCHAVKRTLGENGSVEYKTVDKLKALQLDNELAGHVKPDKQGVSVEVTVRVLSEARREELMAKRMAALNFGKS